MVVNPRRLLTCENAFYRAGGLERRGGTTLIHNPLDVNYMRAGIRAYRGTAARTLVAVGTGVYEYNSGHTTRTNLKGGLSGAGRPTFTAYRTGATDDAILIYFANGENAPITFSLAATPATLDDPFDPVNLPSDVKRFIAHQDRLFAYSKTNPLQVIWCPSLNPTGSWISATPTAGRAIYIPSSDPEITMGVSHKHTTAETGIVSELIFTTASQTWAIIGTQGWGTDATGVVNTVGTDIRLHAVSGIIGSLSPETFVNTPIGLIFLGRVFGRTQLFLLSGFGEQSRLVPIYGIRADLNDIPVSKLYLSAATYADGWYMLSYTLAGDDKNRREMWLQIEGLRRFSDGLWGPFYGPMIRGGNLAGINCYIPFTGGADNNELFVGDSGSGRLAQINSGNDDEGNAVVLKVRTPWMDVGVPHRAKRVAQAYVHTEQNVGNAMHKIHFDYGARDMNDSVPIISISRIGTGTVGSFVIGGQSVGQVTIELADASDTVDLDCEAFSQEIEFAQAGTPFKLHKLGVQYQVLAYDPDRVSA